MDLTPFIPLSLKGKGEEKREGLTPLLMILPSGWMGNICGMSRGCREGGGWEKIT